MSPTDMHRAPNHLVMGCLLAGPALALSASSLQIRTVGLRLAMELGRVRCGSFISLSCFNYLNTKWPYGDKKDALSPLPGDIPWCVCLRAHSVPGPRMRGASHLCLMTRPCLEEEANGRWPEHPGAGEWLGVIGRLIGQELTPASPLSSL